jgi:hypothetical protein
MKPLRHAATPRRASLPGSAAELCDRKGARVVAKAGTATEKDKEAATVEKEAVLSEKILHECRVFFNDFGADLRGNQPARRVRISERAVK